LGFVGIRQRNTFSGFMDFKRTYKPMMNMAFPANSNQNLHKRLLTRSFMSMAKIGNELDRKKLSIAYNNLVEKYGGDGIISNKELYSKVILSDEFKELTVKEKLIFTFGEN
jgi:hypothetical protein